MKCEYCSGNLTLEDEFCPHCGQPNQHAKKHIQDMKRYEGEFQKTKEYVYKKTGLYTALSVRAVVTAVLVVLSALFIIVGNRAWEIQSGIGEAIAARNCDSYSREMDRYLEEEDYLGFYGYCQAREIHSYETPYSEKYGLVIQMSSSYKYAHDSLLSYITCDGEIDNSWVVDSLSDSLDSFYGYYLNEGNFYTNLYGESELFRGIADTMAYNIERILVAYGGLAPEEASALPEMKKSRRAILLEERLEARLSND